MEQAISTAAVTKASPLQSDSALVLTAGGIEKSFGRGMWPFSHRQPVPRGVDLTLHPGEVVGLVGENGSGKSSMMQILVGELAADAARLLAQVYLVAARSSRSSTSA